MKIFMFMLALAGAAGASAPFCVVTSYGENCWYYTASDCYRAARQENGMCVANRSTPNEASPSYPAYPSTPPAKNGYQFLGDALGETAENLSRYQERAEASAAAANERALSEQQLRFEAERHHVWMMQNSPEYKAEHERRARARAMRMEMEREEEFQNAQRNKEREKGFLKLALVGTIAIVSIIGLSTIARD